MFDSIPIEGRVEPCTPETDCGEGFACIDRRCRERTSKSLEVEETPPAGLNRGVARYPAMEAPDEVRVGEAFPLMVSLTMDEPEPEVIAKATGSSEARVEDDGKVVFNLPQTQDSWKLKAVLHAPGFELGPGGRWESSIELPRGGDSTPALFKLVAKPGKKTERKLSVTLWSDTYLARLTRTISVQPDRATSRSRRPAPSKGQEPVAPLSMDVGESRVPDLTVRIQYDDPSALGAGQLIMSSPHTKTQVMVERFSTPGSLPVFLKSYYARFLNTARARGLSLNGGRSGGSARPVALMKGFGKELYRRYAPSKLKEVIAALLARPDRPLRTIQFYSNNPVLPWELMFVSGPGGDDVGFLGTEFVVARWHISDSQRQLDKPLRTLRLDNVVAIAPEYKGARQLPGQKRELAALKKLPVFTRMKGDSGSFETLMGALPSGVVHFSGHGKVQTSPMGVAEFSISLFDGELDLMTWRGFVSPQSRSHPLFFFNACDVGQAKEVAGFVEGWAPAVLESGASGYIGGLWPLTDVPAAEFASRFYQEVDTGLRTRDSA
ncbi:MAG: CHAT domain-containing protein, partial [Myxococcota bacterium]|nr:CHAT domain-containing protein [Myxococcota bacterium]